MSEWKSFLIPTRSVTRPELAPPSRISPRLPRGPAPPPLSEESPPPLGSFRDPREPLLPDDYSVVDQVSALPSILRQGSGHLTGLIASHLSKQDYMRRHRIGLSHPGLKSELQQRHSVRGDDRSNRYRIMNKRAKESPAWIEEIPLNQQPAPIPTRSAAWLGIPGMTPGDRISRWGGKKRRTRRRKLKRHKKTKKYHI
jgi:hypothetical protein